VTTLIPPDYAAWLAELKTTIRTARLKAGLAVNRELVLLYWRIGKEILERQSAQGWGAKVIDQLARDLRAEFSDMRGFSRTNLLYMRAFASAWPEEAIVHQFGGQIPWRHNCVIIDQVKDRPTREWYIRKTIENGDRAGRFSNSRSRRPLTGARVPRKPTSIVRCRGHSPTWRATSSRTPTPSTSSGSRMRQTSAPSKRRSCCA